MKTENTKADFFRLSIQLWGLITAAGVVAGAASLLGFFGSLNWFLDLFSHFRVQYFLALGVVALLLLVPRRRRSAAIFGALAAMNLVVILPLYFGRASPSTLAGQPVRAMLVNVNTRRGNTASVANALRRFNPDIVVLEEVSTKWLSDLGPALGDYGYSEHEPRDDNFGIALFSKFPFTRSQVAYIGDTDVPSIMAEIETERGKCTVLATHPLPPGGGEYSRWRNGQLAQLPQWVHCATSPVLLLGDLNVTPWNPYFRHLLRESGLRDSSQGRGVCPTWPTFNPLMLIPIDHCLYSPGIGIVNRQIGPRVGSDHFPVIVDFVMEAQTKE
jgi:endonuclease/exonuclease/phosphatase (EEP) superfamily protein YafD